MTTEHKPHSVQENIKAIEDALTYAERHLRPEFFSDRRDDARATLAGLVEQLETAHAATEDTALAANLFREQRDRLQEQLETLREALEWCNDHRDSERFHSVAESALNRVSSPASERPS